MDTEESNGQSRNMIVRSQGAPNEEVIQVEPRENSTESSELHVADIARGHTGRETLHFMAWVQANACVGPGVFRGNKSENFDEFIRRFNSRKYGAVGFDDQTLLDIMVDDHLWKGRAKSLLPWHMPSHVSCVEELRRVLTDSTAGRLRALTELRCLKRRIGQSVADFCGVLEDLGRQAYPSCSIKDRSLEYAQIFGLARAYQLLTTLGLRRWTIRQEAYDVGDTGLSSLVILFYCF
ncbi:hypothetical protein OSTOST_22050 [Ostertagia ostertagi]